jgi:hypothetical protein
MHGMMVEDQDQVPSENITKDEMKALIKKYNNSEHSAIGMTPQEMANNPEAEERYIMKMQARDEKQKRKRLSVGTVVRYITPNRTLAKRRYRFSPQLYTIAELNGNMYTIMATDGTAMIKPRYLLKPASRIELRRMKMARSIQGGISVIKEVHDDQSGVPKNKVRVTFYPDYVDVVPKSNLRSRFNMTDI